MCLIISIKRIVISSRISISIRSNQLYFLEMTRKTSDYEYYYQTDSMLYFISDIYLVIVLERVPE